MGRRRTDRHSSWRPATADSRSPEVVTLGECLVALVADAVAPLAEAAVFQRHVAGAEANVAVGVARLGHRSALIGRIGGDGFGTAILRRLRGEGVDVDALTVDPEAPTGVLIRERRALGPAEVVYHRRGSAGSRVSADDVRSAAPLFEDARWFHATGITPAVSIDARRALDVALDLARDHGLRVSLDLNIRRKLWSEEEAAAVLRGLVPRAEFVLAGPDEAALVAGLEVDADAEDAAKALVALGAAVAVVKLGEDGALEADADGAVIHRPGVYVRQVVDAVGAGDAFAAGYIVARLEGLDAGSALELGNMCGAAAVASVGDLTGLPTRAEIDRRLHLSNADVIR